MREETGTHGQRSPAAGGQGAVRTMFFGTGEFGTPSLEALAGNTRFRLVGIVTGPPRPAGRGGNVRSSPIAVHAARLRLEPVLAPRRLRDREAVAEVAARAPELIIVADYGQIVPRALLDLPRLGALNLHPSLLPRHRGATPVPAAILAGDPETGVTLMLMDEGVDSGPILAQTHRALHGDETAPELELALAAEAAGLLQESLPAWIEGALVPHVQPATGVTLTRPLRREDGRLDPCASAARLERQVRAYQPWPGSFLETAAGRLIVWRSVMSSGAPADAMAAPPGTLAADGDGFALRAADGWLRLEEVQLAGGRRMSGAALRRGRPGLVGSRVTQMAVVCAAE